MNKGTTHLPLLRPRWRNLWVTDTLQWRPEARLVRSANPARDSSSTFLLFVASCASKQFASPVNATSVGIYGFSGYNRHSWRAWERCRGSDPFAAFGAGRSAGERHSPNFVI